MSTLWQLLYLSRCAQPFATPAILDLARRSQAANAAVGVTGLLMFDGAGFIQVLEGPEAAVRAVFARIRADPRHREVIVAVDDPVTHRQFGDWSMACRRFTGAADAEAELATLMADLHAVADAQVRALFTGFARRGQLRARSRAGAAAPGDRALDIHLDLVMQQAQDALDQARTLRPPH